MTVNIVVPDLGDSVVEATVLSWLKQEGETVKAGEAVVELETDKVSVEIAAEQGGVLAQIMTPEDTDVQVGDVLGTIDPDGTPGANGGGAQPEAKPAPAEAPAQTQSAPAQATPEAQNGQQVSPVARNLAAAADVDLTQVQGTGPRGRITKADVEGHIEGRSAPAQPAPSTPAPAAPASDLPPALLAPASNGQREERVKMSRRRQTIAKRLLEAKQGTAMLTTFNEVDMTSVMEFRRKHKEAFKEKHGVSLGLSSFFVKASVAALRAFPRINAEIQEKEMVLKHYYDIGIAIGAEEGLIVPVLRDADSMSYAEIERQIREYAAQAQDGTLSLESLRGGTFTITNGGVFGSLLSTPILNPPQVGILGLHGIKDRPVAIDGEVAIRPMMYVALSYDHRIVDGREAVQFLVKLKELIEDVDLLMLEG